MTSSERRPHEGLDNVINLQLHFGFILSQKQADLNKLRSSSYNLTTFPLIQKNELSTKPIFPMDTISCPLKIQPTRPFTSHFSQYNETAGQSQLLRTPIYRTTAKCRSNFRKRNSPCPPLIHVPCLRQEARLCRTITVAALLLDVSIAPIYGNIIRQLFLSSCWTDKDTAGSFDGSSFAFYNSYERVAERPASS